MAIEDRATMTFVIAEVGSNHKSLEDCIQAISMAKGTGADAVKFQYFTESDLYGPARPSTNYKGSLKLVWLQKLKEKADACGIEFMVSAFSPEGISLVNPYVRRHKLASSENNHLFMLNMLYKIGKPVIMSCGASDIGEIGRAIKLLDNKNLTLLYCVCEYPAKETKLEKITALRAAFPDIAIGFSDHSLDYTTIPVCAAHEYKACVIEKHYNPLGYTDTPDACASISHEEFSKMVSRIRSIHFDYKIEYKELEVSAQHKRRIVAVNNIRKGNTINPGDVGIFRLEYKSEHLTSPLRIFDIYGRLSNKDYSIGEPIQL